MYEVCGSQIQLAAQQGESTSISWAMSCSLCHVLLCTFGRLPVTVSGRTPELGLLSENPCLSERGLVLDIIWIDFG